MYALYTLPDPKWIPVFQLLCFALAANIFYFGVLRAGKRKK